jgi:hypothetical protein
MLGSIYISQPPAPPFPKCNLPLNIKLIRNL